MIDMLKMSDYREMRAGIGALVGLMVTGFVSTIALGSSSDVPLLVAPMGAAAVLLFAVEKSPLARPWNVIGGNMLSALVGVTVATLVSNAVIASGLACGGAIVVMMLLRCIHPPGGAVAMTAVLGGPSIQSAGYGFVLWPVGINCVLLLLMAILITRLETWRIETGHRSIAHHSAEV
jgi:CBS domain-containing membrane protein